MTTQKVVVADEELLRHAGALFGQCSDLRRRVMDGTLSYPDWVRPRLQTVIQPDFVPEPEQYPDEDLGECLPYPPGFRHRSVDEQMAVWQKRCPKLDASYVPNLVGRFVPRGMEFWFVCPKPSKAGGLDWALAQIAAQRQLKNWREGRLGEAYLRLVEKTKAAHARLDQQPGDYWVFPAQLGLQHGGRSMRKARLYFRETEFGFGPYKGACAMLTHLDRISGPGQLGLDCPGCEYSPGAGGWFGGCLGFYWSSDDRCLSFINNWAAHAGQSCGPASGVLPAVA